MYLKIRYKKEFAEFRMENMFYGKFYHALHWVLAARQADMRRQALSLTSGMNWKWNRICLKNCLNKLIMH